MINRFVERAEAVARKRQRRRIERILSAIEDRASGVSAEATASTIVLSGRGLVRRWLSDPSLRFTGTLSK